MEKTENTKTVENNDLQIIGKKFVFVINNDENNKKTDTACQAFREWLKTPQNNKKYVNKYGIVGGDWQVDIADVTEFTHVATAQDALTGGEVDVIYLTFTNSLLDRFVYLDSEIRKRGTVLLPINNTVQYVPFDFKYTTAQKHTIKKSTKTDTKTTPTTTKTDTKKSTTQKSTPTKTENKTSKTTQKTTQKTDTTKTTAEKVNR